MIGFIYAISFYRPLDPLILSIDLNDTVDELILIDKLKS